MHTFLIDISLGFMVVPLLLKNCRNCGVSSVSFLCCTYHNSTVAGQNVLGGGGRLGRVKPRGIRGEKNPKIFEIFIPEIAANASNFKN